MTSLERVATILQHKEADRVPVYPLINSISRNYQNINYPTWSMDIDKCAQSIISATDDIGVDVICSLIDLSVEAADFGQKIIYPEHDAAHPALDNRLLPDIGSLKTLQPIDPTRTPRMSDHIRLCQTLMNERGTTHPVVAFVFGPLGILSMLRGQSEIFMDMIDDPSAVHDALSAITETLVIYCKELMKTGVHAVMFDTLFASQSILSKEMWDEFEGPYIERLSRLVHDNNTMVMIHNCGNGIYFDAQIKRMEPEAISFLFPPDDCADFSETKAKYGDQTTLIGYITPSWLLSAEEEEIRKECREEMDTCKKDGGFILATGCEYPSGLPSDKAKIIVDEALRSGQY
ncbi:MAG: uroporphyrinogen decarboxylase family protein [Spirochaetales bacterium]|nr:uroporphyrinogen decarboxylase family protein [Spirochaetales bacterium]